MKNITFVAQHPEKLRDTVFVEFYNTKLELYKEELSGTIRIDDAGNLRIYRKGYVDSTEDVRIVTPVNGTFTLSDGTKVTPPSNSIYTDTLVELPTTRVKWKGVTFDIYEHELDKDLLIIESTREVLVIFPPTRHMGDTILDIEYDRCLGIFKDMNLDWDEDTGAIGVSIKALTVIKQE